MLSTAQEVPDVQVAVTSCNVEADILGNERWGQEKLQRGLCDVATGLTIRSKVGEFYVSDSPFQPCMYPKRPSHDSRHVTGCETWWKW